MTQLESRDFFDRFTALLDLTRERNELDSKHDALIHWYGGYCLYIDSGEIKDRIVIDQHAEGVDALLIDQETLEILFVQAKTVESFDDVSNSFPEKVLKATLAGVRFLIKGDYRGKITPELEDLVNDYHEKVNNGGYKTKVLFLYMKSDPVDLKFVDEFRQEFPSVQVQFCNYRQLMDLYMTKYLALETVRAPERITFNVTASLLKKDTPITARVFTCRGEDLARIYHENKERIFQKNVRYFLGLRSNANINSQILETASEESLSKDFWYYNNGITIVCEGMDIPPSEKVVTLIKPQIINGAQTTSALHDAYQKGELRSDVEVLIKAIQATNKTFIENVTLYTNSQNAIRLRDLCSNDLVQSTIKRVIRDSFGCYYERKRGEFDAEYPTIEAKKKSLGNDFRTKLISNESAAQAFLAMYLDKPSQSKAETGRIFMREKPGFYSEIFQKQDTILPEKLLLAWKLLKFVEGERSKFRKEFKKAPNLDPKMRESIYRFTFLLHSEYFIVDLMKEFLIDRKYKITDELQDIKLVIEMIEERDKQIVSIYEIVIHTLAEYIDQVSKEQGYYHNKFFKSEKSIGLVRNFFNDKYKFVQFLT